MPERGFIETHTAFAPLWDELFPAEQARIVRLLVERAELSTDGIQTRLRAEGAANAGRGTADEGSGMKPRTKAAGDNWCLDGDTITVTIPMAWKHRGDQWKRLLDDGKEPIGRRIGRCRGVTRSFLNRLLRLAPPPEELWRRRTW